MKVLQVFRKRNPQFFSIEKVFSLLRPEIEGKIQLDSILVPYYTRGPLQIFRNLYFVKKLPPRDIYHITGDVHYVVRALPASRTILTIHDCVFMYSTTGFKKRILKWLLLDMPVRRSAQVTTISEFTKQEIVRFTNCDADKIVVIPNPANATIRFEEKVFNATNPVILFIGTTSNKNLERVAPALENINCHLQIVGEPTTAQEQLLAKHRVSYSVVCNISENELANIYIQADIVLFPSLFEGFGLPVLEAQQAGRVLITSNLEPMKTVAGAGALLVDPYNINDIRKGLEKIMGDAGLRNECIEKGFLNVANYKVARIADAYYGVYEKIANRNKTFVKA